MVVIDVVLVVIVADVVVIVVADVDVIVVMDVSVVASTIAVTAGVVVLRTFVKRSGKRMAATISSNRRDMISKMVRRGFLLRSGRDNI